jgi:hypothetical protein
MHIVCFVEFLEHNVEKHSENAHSDNHLIYSNNNKLSAHAEHEEARQRMCTGSTASPPPLLQWQQMTTYVNGYLLPEQ